MKTFAWPLVLVATAIMAGAAAGVGYVVFAMSEQPQQESVLQRVDREAAAVRKSAEALREQYRREGLIK